MLVADNPKGSRQPGHHHGHHHHHGHSDHEHHQENQNIFPLTPMQFKEVVPHRDGFEEDEIRKVFEGAGLTSFLFDSTILNENIGGDTLLFLAKGVKPAL